MGDGTMQGTMAKLRDLREKKGWSQIQLAVNAGVSIGVVQKLEGPGKVEARIATALAEALGVKPEDVDELRPSLGLDG
jgi:transcriptional regulator with XRE-family HTH domain